MARRSRSVNVFGLAFLDAITCGFGAVVLFFMIINASFGKESGRNVAELRGEVDLLEVEVLEGVQRLVELRNSLRRIEQENVIAAGLSRRLIETVTVVQEELATYESSTLAKREHVNKLKADLKSLEEEVKRLSAAAPAEETPGDRVRSFVGDGDRQYLTGLKVGGRRILILLDSSASMLDETIVNIVRRRNMSDEVKRRSPKWQQAVSTVDWLTTQIPRESSFQVYTFSTDARPVIPDTDGNWLDGGSREKLEEAVQRVRGIVPANGTNLHAAFGAIHRMRPPPDNIYLLVDGLPTMGRQPPRGTTISGRDRLKLFEEAINLLRDSVPVNVILFPMEGDAMAASAFWKLALATGGAYVSPSEDWP
ncbi:MAG TPA: VWA domain-containing protein [Vicinamibacteria bacterium]|nr:VWA domain-containing protein [Vicinamibacteria bacterium]